jgi:hypothetical protein
MQARIVLKIPAAHLVGVEYDDGVLTLKMTPDVARKISEGLRLNLANMHPQRAETGGIIIEFPGAHR